MTDRATLLSERFLQVYDDVLAVVEQCLDDQWKMVCVEEGESVAVVIHHIAVAPCVLICSETDAVPRSVSNRASGVAYDHLNHTDGTPELDRC